MKHATHATLRELSAATGKEYGKLVQKLLAIAFLDAGADDLTDRCVQGIDLELGVAGRRLAFEVKTCEGGGLTLGKKDLDGLARERDAGREAFVAALGDRPTDEWVFARFAPDELPASKRIPLFGLRAYRDRELEQRVARAFERAVERHATAAARGGQAALDEVLATYPARRLA